LRAQLNTPLALTQLWVLVAASGGIVSGGIASGGIVGLEITLPQVTSARNSKEPNWQLVIDVSYMGLEVIKKVVTTKVVK